MLPSVKARADIQLGAADIHQPAGSRRLAGITASASIFPPDVPPRKPRNFLRPARYTGISPDKCRNLTRIYRSSRGNAWSRENKPDVRGCSRLLLHPSPLFARRYGTDGAGLGTDAAFPAKLAHAEGYGARCGKRQVRRQGGQTNHRPVFGRYYDIQTGKLPQAAASTANAGNTPNPFIIVAP